MADESYLTTRVQDLEVAFVFGGAVIPVSLQDKLEVEVLPVVGGVDDVGVHPLPRLVLCGVEKFGE